MKRMLFAVVLFCAVGTSAQPASAEPCEKGEISVHIDEQNPIACLPTP